MKRSRILSGLAVFAWVVMLSACNRSSASRDGQISDAPKDGAPAIDAPAAPDHASDFKASLHPLLGSGDVPMLEQIDRENTRVVGAAMPSIVRVTAMTQVDPHSQLLGFPFRFPGVPHGLRTMVPSYGSGVIISNDGYIVTNFHVIRDAHSVDVQLHDQSSYPARIIASDQDTDIAVLKIDATDLPAMAWGNSDKVQVGQQVFALGNPFNLDTSVSKGIVSGIGRDLPDVESGGAGDARPEYEDYIQTDAAINVGNSGGALIDIHGELIGINAAIASFTQGSEGVGFSIPSNLVRSTVEQLIRQGRLIRGYLGVRLPVKIDDGVPEQLGIDAKRGALLAGIQRSSPADQARLRPVDCIVEVDGHKIDSLPQFRLIVSQIPVGKQVVLNYIRAGAQRTATVKIAELPKDPEPLDSALPPDDDPGPPPSVTLTSLPQGNNALAGVEVSDLTDKSRQQFGVEDFVTSGVVVTGVQEGTPADTKGLLRGDVIEIACAQRGTLLPLAKASDFSDLAKSLREDQSVVVLVHHGKLSGAEDRLSTFLYLAPSGK
jgi:serine protease Do